MVFDGEALEGEVLPPVSVPEVRTLSVQQRVNIHLMAPVIRAFFTAVDKSLENDIHAGVPVPLLHMVQDQGDRKYKPDVTGASLARLLDIPEKDIYTTKLITPPQAQELVYKRLRANKVKAKVAEAQAKDLIATVTVRPLTKPKLGLLTDERVALPTVTDVFEGE